MSTVTVSSKGQVVIPAAIRHRLGIAPGSVLEFVEEGDGVLRVIVRRAIGESTLDEGYGMLRYEGTPHRLSEFDVAQAMRDET